MIPTELLRNYAIYQASKEVNRTYHEDILHLQVGQMKTDKRNSHLRLRSGLLYNLVLSRLAKVEEWDVAKTSALTARPLDWCCFREDARKRTLARGRRCRGL